MIVHSHSLIIHGDHKIPLAIIVITLHIIHCKFRVKRKSEDPLRGLSLDKDVITHLQAALTADTGIFKVLAISS